MTATIATGDAKKTSKFRDPAWQATVLLRVVLTIAILITGLDKFFNLLTFWPKYLAPVATDVAPLAGQQFMQMVGGIEVAIGIAIIFVPRYGSMLLAGWLSLIIVNLLIVGDFYDVALRDLGLVVAALALFRLTFYNPTGASNGKHRLEESDAGFTVRVRQPS